MHVFLKYKILFRLFPPPSRHFRSRRLEKQHDAARTSLENSRRTRKVEEIVTSDWRGRQLDYSLEQPLIIDARMQTSKQRERERERERRLFHGLIAQVIRKAARDFAGHSA